MKQCFGSNPVSSGACFIGFGHVFSLRWIICCPGNQLVAEWRDLGALGQDVGRGGAVKDIDLPTRRGHVLFDPGKFS